MSEELSASLSALLLSLAATALHYLGRPITEGNSKPEVNLPLARHTIDTLEMLKQKTEGNRSPDETKLLNDLIYQLRIAYLQASNESEDQSGKKREDKN
ncbi:MAG: DUF1844 domain-containing protein [bacterium]